MLQKPPLLFSTRAHKSRILGGSMKSAYINCIELYSVLGYHLMPTWLPPRKIRDLHKNKNTSFFPLLFVGFGFLFFISNWYFLYFYCQVIFPGSYIVSQFGCRKYARKFECRPDFALTWYLNSDFIQGPCSFLVRALLLSFAV